MCEKIMLIDGNSIMNRAFYGLPDLTNAQGLHTNAIYGFLNILFKFLDEEAPTYLAVAFDVHAPTFRHELYADYKGTRKPMADELVEQVPVLKDLLHAMGIQTMEQAGLEADDLLGTISRQMEQAGLSVTILSGDKDLMQLVTDHVKLRIPKTSQGQTEVEDYDRDAFIDRYQVTPQEFIDVKALMGDASDHIPGLPGVGEKTAFAIIRQYHSIENAHDHADEVKPPRAAKALTEHWEEAVLSKRLSAIRTDADLSFDLEAARLGDIYTEAAYEICQQLQFKNFLPRFCVEPKENPVEEFFRTITDRKEAEDFFVRAATADRIGVALYQNLDDVLPLFASEAPIGGVAVACSDREIACISCGEEMDADWLMDAVSNLNGQVGTFVMFDIKSALPYLHLQAEDRCFDASVAAYLLNPISNHYDAADVAAEQLSLTVDEGADGERLACYEAYTAYAAYAPLSEKLTQTGMATLFYEVEMPLVFTLYDMEVAGMKVDGEALRAYGKELGARIRELEQEIYADAGETFNINSPKQLGVVLFEHLAIPGGRKTKTGYSTAADVLEKLAPEHPIIGKILEYRQYTKLKSTYADGLAGYIAEDGRIHTKFNQTVTATGRLSSTEPNLQNIPIRMELGRLIRKVFIPADGYLFVDADYSQIELRILASCSNDEQLIEAYKEAKDIHRLTASQVFHVPFDEVTPLQRRNAKAVNFGIVYGISSFGLSQDLSITRQEAARYIEDYFETYPGIKRYLDGCVASAKEKGYAQTMFGRRRPIPELTSSNYSQRSFGERVAMNAPIQGAAADIIKKAMVGVKKRLDAESLKSRLVLQVHDELLIETWEPELDQVKQILTEEMEQAATLNVPLKVDIHTGQDWYEAK